LNGAPARVLVAVEKNAYKKRGKPSSRKTKKRWAPQIPPEFAGRGVQERIGKVVEAVELKALVGNRDRRARLPCAHHSAAVSSSAI